MNGAGIVAMRGQVTGGIGPGKVGEVRISYCGGTNKFLAYAFDGVSDIPVGHTVLVIEYLPPVSVLVTDLTPDLGPLDL